MASVEDCRDAVDALVATLASVDAELRAKHVPERSVACRIGDLGLTFTARLDEHGVHDVRELDGEDVTADADVRIALDSDELVALAAGSDDFLHAWLRGRVQVGASMRDLLRLRTFFGL